MNKVKKFTEFETKYQVKIDKILEFKHLASSLSPVKFLYAEGWDTYMVKDQAFWRIRVSDNQEPKFIELTKKVRTSQSDSVNRREWNVPIDPKANIDELKEAIEQDGYKEGFSIWKSAHVFWFKDATLSFYSVRHKNQQPSEFRHFFEIEVNESIIDTLSEDECLAIIKKYERLFSKVGISGKTRVKLTLFDMYKDI